MMDHKDSLRILKKNGFSDTQLARAMNKTELEVRRERKNQSILPSYKVISLIWVIKTIREDEKKAFFNNKELSELSPKNI